MTRAPSGTPGHESLQTIALHTRLKAGKEAEYEAIHEVIPADLDRRLREAGVREWKIWRDGQELFHVVVVQDYGRMRAELSADPVNVAWQQRLAHLFEVPDDYSGGDGGIGHVWSLPAEPAGS